MDVMSQAAEKPGGGESFAAPPVRAVFQGQPVEVHPRRFVLNDANWRALPIPQVGVIKWTMRNEAAANVLDVSYEKQVDQGTPNFFTLAARGSYRDSVSETWVPQAIWVRRNVAAHAVYLEVVLPPGASGDVYSELLGGDLNV